MPLLNCHNALSEYHNPIRLYLFSINYPNPLSDYPDPQSDYPNAL